MNKRFGVSVFIQEGEAWTTSGFERDVYLGEPSNLVRILNEFACDEIVISAINTDDAVLQTISDQASMPLAIGGQITSVKRAVQLSSMGFEKISVSSSYLDRPAIVSEICGELGRASTMVTLAVAIIDGDYHLWDWRNKHATPLKLGQVLQQMDYDSIGELCIRDVGRNGALSGPDLDLARHIRSSARGNLIFEGGIRAPEDISKLWEIGIDSVLGASSVSLYGRYRASLLDYAKPKSGLN